MGGTPPPPPGFKVDTPAPPPGFKLDKGTDLPGSVFDKPTAGQRLKRIGKAVAPFVAGTALPIAASALVGPEAALPVKVGAQALAGAAQPYVEAGVNKLTGGSPQAPTLRTVVTSAAFNAGLSALGESLTPGKASKVAGQIKGLPEEAQTVGNVKQAMRNRDFWIKSGASPEQADRIVTMPETDLEALTKQNVKAGQDFKGAFQSVLDHQRAEFKTRYDAVLGEAGKAPGDPLPIGQAFENAAQGAGQHELSPAFRGFLQRKGLEITHAGESGGPSVGGTPWKQLPQKLKDQIIAAGGAKDIQSPGGSPNELRQLRTELRENVPSNATNLDKQTANQLNEMLTKEIDSRMTAAGAQPEQIAAMHSLDEEYGRFQDTIKKLDPRSGTFGSQISDLLFDKQMKNPEQAVNFIRMAQAAEQANPGEVMPQLQSSMMDHILSETKQQAQGRPVEEMRLIQNLQKQWGGDRNASAVMGAVFGKDSPMANLTTASKVLGALANPDAVASKTAEKSGLGAFQLTVPHFLLRLGVAYAAYSALTGSPTGPWQDMRKDPTRFLLGLAGLMASTTVASKIMSSTDTALKDSYVNWLLDPSDKTISNLGTRMGAVAGGITSAPTPSSGSAPPPHGSTPAS